jgi:hypothetical protein
MKKTEALKREDVCPRLIVVETEFKPGSIFC